MTFQYRDESIPQDILIEFRQVFAGTDLASVIEELSNPQLWGRFQVAVAIGRLKSLCRYVPSPIKDELAHFLGQVFLKLLGLEEFKAALNWAILIEKSAGQLSLETLEKIKL